MIKKILHLAIFLCAILLSTGLLYADEYTGVNFKVLDPVINPGHYSTSGSFGLFSTLSEIAIGTSTSLNFGINSGSLYFPFASTPVVNATAGDAQVSLSWTASNGFLGWNPASYSVGQATVSGGPYTFTNVGLTLSSIRTSLTNGTNYYFIVVAKDASDYPVATSSQVSATPAASGGGGGGGGGGSGNTGTGVQFLGRAYPLSKVTILKDGQVAVTTIAGPDSNFDVLLNNLNTGDYTFSVYGEDNNRNKSSHFTFPIFITSNVITKVSGIFIAPTIAVDKSEVRKGDPIAIFGQSTPSASIVINVNSETPHFVTSPSDSNGIYLYNFDTSVLEIGSHNTNSKAVKGAEISQISNVVNFKVGTVNVPVAEKKCDLRADMNGDCRVNLVDFSILAFWYKKPNPPSQKDLNNDNMINLVDFSIMAYYWTG